MLGFLLTPCLVLLLVMPPSFIVALASLVLVSQAIRLLGVTITLMRGVLMAGLWPERRGIHLEITPRCLMGNSRYHLCERLGIKRDETLREQRCTV